MPSLSSTYIHFQEAVSLSTKVTHIQIWKLESTGHWTYTNSK